MAKTWFITGATRGLGVAIGKAAMQAGDRVVATGRDAAQVSRQFGAESEQLLALTLDVTDAAQVRRAVDAAVKRFGGIDVLVNNAGYGHLGYFEENTPDDVKQQFDVNVFGLFNVTWAVLPIMRKARRGVVYNLSSVAGLRGNDYGSLYSASKFAVEGFSESLAKEVAPFGIAVVIVEPGPFRTDFLSRQSLKFGGTRIADYDERRDQLQARFEDRNGQQPGDPDKLGAALVRIAHEAKPPLRFAAGAFAVQTARAKYTSMLAELEAWKQASIDTDFDA